MRIKPRGPSCAFGVEGGRADPANIYPVIDDWVHLWRLLRGRASLVAGCVGGCFDFRTSRTKGGTESLGLDGSVICLNTPLALLGEHI